MGLEISLHNIEYTVNFHKLLFFYFKKYLYDVALYLKNCNARMHFFRASYRCVSMELRRDTVARPDHCTGAQRSTPKGLVDDEAHTIIGF